MNILNKSYMPLIAIFILGLLVFIPRLDTLPFRGEEPRRVISAFEMVQSGNLIVPTIQKHVFLSRPPLQNWVIAATGFLRGTYDQLTGRLPSVLCALLTAFLIYYYSSACLSRGTAFLASLAFITMPQVIQLGRTAETELMFTLFLSSSFLLWHRGELKNWPGYLKWGVAYFFLALATLTKGINQAPIYFAAIIGIYLLINRQVKTLFSLSHLFGCALFLMLVGLWQWSFIHYVGSKTGWLMHAGDVGLRFEQFGLKHYLEHAVVFPIELFAVMLPWSLFLGCYFTRSFWQQSLNPKAKPIVFFCISALLITIFSVWFPPGSRTRYYMPLFPCFAILSAIGLHTVTKQTSTILAKLLVVLMPIVGSINFALSFFEITIAVAPAPLSHAAIYLFATVVLSMLLKGSQTFKFLSPLFASALCYALFAALTISFIYTDSRIASYNKIEPPLQSVLHKLPKDTQLVSLGAIAFDFLYYYMLHTGQTIPIVSYEELAHSAPLKPTYFCARSHTLANNPLKYKFISVLKTGRYKKGYTNQPMQTMIIGKLETKAF